ncbi:TIGR03943 family putative permease subunit [Streptomyces sp. NPDC015131]|uniref:TIGR03943 family putative permease subunit n=1 Tax=Streptomyces sp. NPDC015131 TaxID=3364941 RepID=UPI0036FA8B17
MTRRFQIALLVLLGAAVLRVSLLSELYLRYVKAGLRLPLIATGVLLLALGVAAAVREARAHLRDRPADQATDAPERAHGSGGDDGHGHSHAHGPRVAWLLYVPAVMLLLFAPPALGSYTAARDEMVAGPRTGTFPPLPEGDPLPLAVRDFSARAVHDTGRSLDGRTVRLTGFVTPGEDGGWYLSRLLIACCAADAGVLKVRVHGAGAPPADAWVTVTGVWRPAGRPGADDARPELDATGVERAAQPKDPYADTPPAARAEAG